MGVFACPIDINALVTEETLENRYEETMTRLKKSKTLVTLFFRSGGVSLQNYCATLLALKMNFARTPM